MTEVLILYRLPTNILTKTNLYLQYGLFYKFQTETEKKGYCFDRVLGSHELTYIGCLLQIPKKHAQST